LLKETKQQMAPLLAFIFQASLDKGTLPSDWKQLISHLYAKMGTEQTPQITDQFT